MHIQSTTSLKFAPRTPSESYLTRTARRLVHARLRAIQHGQLTITDGLGTERFGPAGTERHEVVVRDPAFYPRLLLGGSVAAGESFADGQWTTPDLTGILRLMLKNRSVLDGLQNPLMRRVARLYDLVTLRSTANTREGSRRNIAAHYDLSNEFFRLWLDERMMYSSAVFDRPDMTLDAASECKLERLAGLLDLKPGDHILEIGSGWGGLAEFLASRYDVKVTTTTISNAQYVEAVDRIAGAGLQDRVEVLLEDYRELSGHYDKAVSVEMVEAVGDDFVDAYFDRVDSLLKPGGVFVMQAITIQDQRYERALGEVDFIKKHIFPGSFIPSVSRLVDAAAKTSGLRLTALDDIGQDYAVTLERWASRFAARSADLDSLGFDEGFQRLWQFYFSYCEAGFREETISDVQLAFKKAIA